VELAQGRSTQAAALLAESRRLLEKNHPLGKGGNNAWRYALWNVVDAGVLAAAGAGAGAGAGAKRSLNEARGPILLRFGDSGFYTALLRRRAEQVDRLVRLATVTSR